MADYIIYCDGAYSSSRDKGGVGFVILKDNINICSYSKMFKHTTNQRMEILALTIALESIKNSSNITAYTDSMYLVGTLTKNWKRKKNVDLWERLDLAIAKHKNFNIIWCKGHDSTEYNNQADKLAYNASHMIG